MIEKALTIDGWMTESELAFLYAIGSKMPEGAQVAEIGSWKGRSTVAICEALQKRGGKLFCVDTFAGDPCIATLKLSVDLENDEVYTNFLHNTQEYDFLKVVRATSAQGVTQFADGSLDWVFIDADHSFEAVSADVAAWYPKVKPGGILSGHDYGYFPVIMALRRYFSHVCAWDTIWYVRHDGRLLKPRPLGLAEIAARRILKRGKF